ncbi:MAG: hypothetical protein ACRC6E_13940 [Fusobacteriaceae bacterium]
MFKVGDKVWDIRFGWGKVIDTKHTKTLPICVEFGSRYIKYAIDGRDRNDDYCINRSLFFQELVITEEALKKAKWRAKTNDDVYFTVDGKGEVVCWADDYSEYDDAMYRVGNYFETTEEAEESKFYKVFHEEEMI